MCIEENYINTFDDAKKLHKYIWWRKDCYRWSGRSDDCRVASGRRLGGPLWPLAWRPLCHTSSTVLYSSIIILVFTICIPHVKNKFYILHFGFLPLALHGDLFVKILFFFLGFTISYSSTFVILKEPIVAPYLGTPLSYFCTRRCNCIMCVILPVHWCLAPLISQIYETRLTGSEL